MVGYAGIVMILNTVVQCLLLLGADRLCHRHTQWMRVLLGGTVGGLYAGICLLRDLGFLSNPFWRLAIFAVMAVLAFGVDLDAIRRGAVFVLLNMALEGIAVGLGTDSLWYCALAVGLLGILCRIGFYGKGNGANYIPVELFHAGKKIRVTALRDTGNMLTDPVTGQPVLIVSPRVACEITGLSPQQLRGPLDAMVNAGIPGLRLIPYRTIGQGSAFLLALRMHVKMENRAGKCLVAFAPEEFQKEGAYQALTGGAV